MNQTRGAELDRYLAEINRRLARLPRAQRQEVVAGLREHIAELGAAGVDASEIIARLGTAETVADAAAMELPALRRFLDAKRWVQFASVLLAFAGSWSVLFATVHEEYSESLDGVSTITYFRVGDLLGWPTALVLAAAPLVFTIAPTVFDGKIRQTTLVLCTALLAVTTFVSGLTVGSFLIAALLVAICACLLPPRGQQATRPRHRMAETSDATIHHQRERDKPATSRRSLVASAYRNRLASPLSHFADRRLGSDT